MKEDSIMKKILPIFLTLILIVSVFSGCSTDISDKLVGHTWVCESSSEGLNESITTEVETLVFYENGTASYEWQISGEFPNGGINKRPPITATKIWTISEKEIIYLSYEDGTGSVKGSLSSNGKLLAFDDGTVYTRQ